MKKYFLLLCLIFISQKKIFCQSDFIDLMGSEENSFTKIPPPLNFQSGLRTATFNITFNTFTPEAQTAFQYAADIWSSIITSNIPIKVNAYFTPLLPGLLGITLPNGRKDFAGAPVAGVWYSSALANAIADSELNAGEFDFDLFLNSSTNWYYGTDGNCPAGKYDLVSIVLHEMCHGLGFVGLAKTKDGLGSFGLVEASDFFPIVTSFPFPDLQGKPGIFDHFLVNSFENNLTDTLAFPNNSTQLADEFTSNGVYFSGEKSLEINNNIEPRIYAPSAFSLGSSLVHLNEATYPAGNENDLMTPFSGTAEVTHDPGPITIAMLEDIGWKVNYNVGIEEKKNDFTIQIFPNPVSTSFFISGNNTATVKITVTDLRGCALIEKYFRQNSPGNFEESIDASALPPGIYFVTAGNENQLAVIKLMKQ